MTATASRTTCQGCGVPIPPSRGGRARQWCSERCRKLQYAGTCEVCGGPTDGTTPSRAPAARVCQECRNWTEAAVIDAMRRWADEHGGIPPREHDWSPQPPGYPHSTTRLIKRAGWNNLLLRAGFQLHCDRRPETLEWIVERLRAGVPTSEIADALGVTPDAIHMRMRYRGTTVEKVRAGEPVRP